MRLPKILVLTLNTLTQSEKSENLKSVQVYEMSGPPDGSTCTIIASTWLATGIAWPKRMHGLVASGGGPGGGGIGGGGLVQFGQPAPGSNDAL